MDLLDVALRLCAAALIGVALGLNRDLRGKAAGVRTLGIVGLGSALLVLATGGISSPETSRVVQGIVTGIGFLGAGVIVRNKGQDIQGLTTAACIWLTACAGVACGVAEWHAIAITVPLLFIILVFGGPFERAVHEWWPDRGSDDAG